MTVELIYDRDCPNVDGTRANLRAAFAACRLEASWTEWDHATPGTPPHVTGYGSPTILIDGVDVAGAAPAVGATCCRIYNSGTGPGAGVPGVELIQQALDRSISRRQ